MKLIVDVPHSLYANLSTIKNESVAGKRILECVKNGTPLQYNSINYIDRDEAVEAIQKKAKRIKNSDTINGLCGEDIHVKEVMNVPQYEICPICGARMESATETWKGYHGHITAPEGTFYKIFNEADEEDDDI